MAPTPSASSTCRYTAPRVRRRRRRRRLSRRSEAEEDSGAGAAPILAPTVDADDAAAGSAADRQRRRPRPERGTGTGGAPAGIATGVEPALPDPRIELRPNALRLPLTHGAEKRQRGQGDLHGVSRSRRSAPKRHGARARATGRSSATARSTASTRSTIYLGKFKIPVGDSRRAAVQLRRRRRQSHHQGRNATWIQNDIYTHSQGLSEDDFRAAVQAHPRAEGARGERGARTSGSRPRRSFPEAQLSSACRRPAVSAAGPAPRTDETRRTRRRAWRSRRRVRPRSSARRHSPVRARPSDRDASSVFTVASSPSRARDDVAVLRASPTG